MLYRDPENPTREELLSERERDRNKMDWFRKTLVSVWTLCAVLGYAVITRTAAVGIAERELLRERDHAIFIRVGLNDDIRYSRQNREMCERELTAMRHRASHLESFRVCVENSISLDAHPRMSNIHGCVDEFYRSIRQSPTPQGIP